MKEKQISATSQRTDKCETESCHTNRAIFGRVLYASPFLISIIK